MYLSNMDEMRTIELDDLSILAAVFPKQIVQLPEDTFMFPFFRSTYAGTPAAKEASTLEQHRFEPA